MIVSNEVIVRFSITQKLCELTSTDYANSGIIFGLDNSVTKNKKTVITQTGYTYS